MKFLDQARIYLKAGKAVMAVVVSVVRSLLNMVVQMEVMEVMGDQFFKS